MILNPLKDVHSTVYKNGIKTILCHILGVSEWCLRYIKDVAFFTV